MLVLSKAAEGEFGENDIVLMRIFSSHLALAMSQSQLIESSQFIQKQLYRVLCSVQDMPLTDRYSEAYKQMLIHVQQITAGRTCGVYMLKEDKLQLVAGSGDLPKIALRGMPVYKAWKTKSIQLNTADGRAGPGLTMMCAPVLVFETNQAATYVFALVRLCIHLSAAAVWQ